MAEYEAAIHLAAAEMIGSGHELGPGERAIADLATRLLHADD